MPPDDHVENIKGVNDVDAHDFVGSVSKLLKYLFVFLNLANHKYIRHTVS